MRDNYNRLYELYDFINMLCAAEFAGVTREQIVEHFGWEMRTLERMLSVVETMFGDALKREYTDTAPRRKVYRLVNPDLSRLPKNVITSDELAGLKTAANALRENTKLARHLDSVANKLTHISKSVRADADDIFALSGVALMPRPQIQYNREIMATIQNAILSCNQLEIKYKGKKHILCPLGILYGWHNNYLIASHERHLDNPLRYICGDIESVTVLNKGFDCGDFDMREYAKKSFGVYVTDHGGYDVVWRVAPDAAMDAKKYKFHPTQKLTESKDGSLTICFHADGLREMAWHLFTWGGKIVPVAPAELVYEYKTLLQQSLNSLK